MILNLKNLLVVEYEIFIIKVGMCEIGNIHRLEILLRVCIGLNLIFAE